MVLFTLAGVGAAWLFEYPSATPIGIVLGLVVASLVPGGSSCSLPREGGEESAKELRGGE